MAFAHQVKHGWMLGQIFILSEDIQAEIWNGHEGEARRKGLPEFTLRTYPKGSWVKVVAVSRFADCGITDDLGAENGYHARVDPILLFRPDETPEQTAAKKAVSEAYKLQQKEWKKQNEVRAARAAEKEHGSTRSYCRLFDGQNTGLPHRRCWLLPGHQSDCVPKIEVVWTEQ